MKKKTFDDHNRSVIKQRMDETNEQELREQVDKDFVDTLPAALISETPSIRTFNTGATRDTLRGKLSYVEALSPVVLQRYLQYLDKHRLQPDGKMRDFNNWKRGIDKDTYLDSMGRHFVSSWLIHQGFPASDNHGEIDIEDALCAIMFNAMGYLFELLKDEKK